MNSEEARQVDAQARERFAYEVSPFNLTHWRSHRDAVLAGQPWRGACADLTSTVLDIATRKNDAAPLSACFRLLVSIDGGPDPDHAVACIRTSDAGFVILGDTTRPGTYLRGTMLHRPHSYNCLVEAGVNPIWRGGVPW